MLMLNQVIKKVVVYLQDLVQLEEKKIFYSRRCDSFWIRPDTKEPVEAMALEAVASYNERIKDLILLEYAPQRLGDLGLLSYLKN